VQTKDPEGVHTHGVLFNVKTVSKQFIVRDKVHKQASLCVKVLVATDGPFGAAVH